MTGDVVRIAMWSGPRNISTAMMRSFENRPDTAVVDEPFYAVYLKATGAAHPLRNEVLASQPLDWREVVRALEGPVPKGRRVFYQKHMTHHMLREIGRDWIQGMRNAFLIRAPEDVLLSYAEVRGTATPEEIGVPQQRELFDREADRLGHAPPVIDTKDVLRDPKSVLSALCKALGIPFSERMLNWPAGRRDSDGVWAPAWYGSVEKSTGFVAPRGQRQALPDDLKRVVDLVRGDYERLSAFKLPQA
ncbi:MAG: HAD family hydrolase [Micropepsaceae bacterium]